MLTIVSGLDPSFKPQREGPKIYFKMVCTTHLIQHLSDLILAARLSAREVQLKEEVRDQLAKLRLATDQSRGIEVIPSVMTMIHD